MNSEECMAPREPDVSPSRTMNKTEGQSVNLRCVLDSPRRSASGTAGACGAAAPAGCGSSSSCWRSALRGRPGCPHKSHSCSQDAPIAGQGRASPGLGQGSLPSAAGSTPSTSAETRSTTCSFAGITAAPAPTGLLAGHQKAPGEKKSPLPTRTRGITHLRGLHWLLTCL